MKRSEVSEEVRYVWTCPSCEAINEDCDDPNYEDAYFCSECGDTVELEDEE